jgi:hypothetical protein
VKIIDNINQLLGDDIKQTITPNTKLQIAASCFSIYAYEALKKELKDIDSLEFIFTSPTFIPNEAIDNIKKNKENTLFLNMKEKKVFMVVSLSYS